MQSTFSFLTFFDLAENRGTARGERIVVARPIRRTLARQRIEA